MNSRRRKQWGEVIFEEGIFKKLPKLMKDMKFQVQEAEWAMVPHSPPLEKEMIP
jgi:hypothetical protein